VKVKQESEFRQLWGLLKTYIRPYWRQFALLLFAYLIASLLTAAQPVIMAPVLEVALRGPDGFTELAANPPADLSEVNLNNVAQFLLHKFFPSANSSWDIVVTVALVYLAVSVTLYALNFLVYLLGIWVRLKAGRDMQVSLFSHVIGLSLDFFNKRRTGELISRLDKDTDAVVFGLEGITRTLIVSTVLVLIYGTLLLRTSPRLTLFILFAAAVQYIFVQAVRRPVQRRVREQFNAQAEFTSYVQEIISNIRVIKSFVAEKYEHSRMRGFAQKTADALMRSSALKHIDEPSTQIINAVTNVGILLFATNEMLSGRLSTTGFFLYLYVGRSVLDPLTAIARTVKVIQTTLTSSERVQSLFAEVATVQNGPISKTSFERELAFKNISFSYGNEHVLENVNLEFRKGETTALVGPSGAGKSTLIDLILRFYDPQNGYITLDGLTLPELNLDEYRRMIGVVSQDSILFNAPVAQNIAYPSVEIDMARVRDAARVANAGEFIDGLPQGYETFVGDRGVLLSGGQKQRVTIARAIYNNPQLLILDEATSSLDTESERLVQQAIDKVIESTTAVVIAHRLSTVIHADKIVVLENGRVLDQGKHAGLYERCALYRNLCDLQFETGKASVAVIDSENQNV
jgi:subfamily B ATP-binding cassette protein MsbA